ncbi:MAG: hypothetical protein J6S26_01085 [Solobacterium sp.]|nr:hypothetical protein [Solobacterium sp.]
MTDSRIRKRITCVCTALLILTGCANKAPSSKPEETVSPQVSAEPAADSTVTGQDAEQISENVLLAMEKKDDLLPGSA